MSKQTINQGNPPIVWSTIDEAFEKINSNFTELYLSIGGPGVDLSSISSSIIPDVDIGRDLGSPTRRWRDLYLGPESLYLGNAQISANLDGSVNLPAGSYVGGELIRNPSESSFKIVRISGQSDVVANDFQGVLNLSGSFISVTTNPITDTLLFTNTGVTTISGSPAISVSSASGNVTITNTGVTSLTSGNGINVSSATGGVTIENTGVLELTTDPGSGITISAGTGVINISNAAPNVNQNVFQFINVGPDTLDPDNPSDTLEIIQGTGISLAVNNISKSLTITNNGVTSLTVGAGLTVSSGAGAVTLNLSSPIINNFIGDLKGSVFADDSTVMVDAVSGTLRGIFIGSVFTDNSTQIIDGNTATVYGNIEATTLRTSETKIALGSNAGLNQGNQTVAVGELAGSVDQGNRTVSIGSQAGQYRQSAYSVAIGPSSGFYEQGDSSVAIGDNAGQSSQGDYAIAVGYYAGHNNQSANSIILNASGAILNGAAAGFFVNPIRSTTSSARPVVYDTTTKELFYTSTLEFINSTISTTDSSGLTVGVLTTFNSDVVVENDITVAERLTVKGSRVINLTELQSVVAASISFADFQTRIAALV